MSLILSGDRTGADLATAIGHAKLILSNPRFPRHAHLDRLVALVDVELQELPVGGRPSVREADVVAGAAVLVDIRNMMLSLQLMDATKGVH